MIENRAMKATICGIPVVVALLVVSTVLGATLSTVATPTLNPGAKTFTDSSLLVTLSCATSGTTIRYTTNGNDPTERDLPYTSPVCLTSTATLKAKAFKANMNPSAVASATYTKQMLTVATPTLDPGGKTFTDSSLLVALSCATSGATIRYTTNGNDPTASDMVYTSKVCLTNTATVEARAFKVNMNPSAVASASYTKQMLPVATPTFSPAATFIKSMQVGIYCTTGGATIRYTTNGVEPTSSSPVYTGPLTITATTTVKAKAFKTGMSDSATASETYTNCKDYQLVLDSGNNTLPALVVSQPTTVRGTIKCNGLAAKNLTFGVHDGISQRSYLPTTDSSGRFSFTSTPTVAKPAVVEYLIGGGMFAQSVYEVKDGSQNAKSWIVKEIRLKNATNKPVSLATKGPSGNPLALTVQPGTTQTVAKRNSPAFTFEPTAYTGTFVTAGVGAGDVTASVTVDGQGVATIEFTGGVGVLLRFSVFSSSDLSHGVCWSPGRSVGAGAGADIQADICVGTSGISIGGSLGAGVVTNGFTVQVVKW